jgi:hypothetical protein
MIWSHRGLAIPLEVYHGVPPGWYRADILAAHRRLGGSFDLTGPDATEPGAPSWMPERFEWLQYRETLYRVADGIGAGDAACIEIAVRFIELRYIGSYSGYIRQLLARRLKQARLSPDQADRLHAHFSSLVLSDERTQEYKEYLPLWRNIVDDRRMIALLAELRTRSNGEARAAWWLPKLRPGNSF